MTSEANDVKDVGQIPVVGGKFKAFDFRSASWWAGPWWGVLLKGIFALTMGIFAWSWPVQTLFVLLLVFGVYAVVDGIFTIITSATHRKTMKEWGWSLAGGIFGTTIGFLILVWPVTTAVVFLIFIAVWMMITGVFNIINAASHRKEMPQWGWPLATGIISIVFSILLTVNMAAGALTLIWVWATFGIVYGTLMCIQAFRTRRTIKLEKS